MVNNTIDRRSLAEELVSKAAGIRLVLTDCDGVLTGGGVYYTAWGEELRRFSILDGMAVALLKEECIDAGIVSGEDSPIIRRRGDKLGMFPLGLGIRDKHAYVGAFLHEHGLGWNQVAYIGDDINDVGVMREIFGTGLTGCPPAAIQPVCRVADYKTVRQGGDGAFREFVDWILHLRKNTGSPRDHEMSHGQLQE
jgi:3-deoxy-D-manno-octulosonate 8-phosphate phosphatase (KDO 8-P phosphatase)